MEEVAIVSACRTATGGFGGTLKELNCAGLGAVVMQGRWPGQASTPGGLIDDVRFGCCMEPVDALNVTRISALMAGIPETVTAVTMKLV